MINLVVISSIFLLMKQVLLEKYIIVVEQIDMQSFTRWGGASQDPKGWGWCKKIFSILWGRTEMGKDKTMWGGDEDPFFWPHPAPLPSLISNPKISLTVHKSSIMQPIDTARATKIKYLFPYLVAIFLCLAKTRIKEQLPR